MIYDLIVGLFPRNVVKKLKWKAFYKTDVWNSMAMLENEEKCILHTLLLLIYISSSYDATREDKIKMIFVNSPRNAGTAPSALGTEKGTSELSELSKKQQQQK